jgi:hypothetical protein
MNNAVTTNAQLAANPRGSVSLPKTLVGLALLFTLGAGTMPVGAHDIYHNLWSREGKRCCNDADCRPADYRRTPSGVQMNVDDLWLPIPHDRIQYVLIAGDHARTRGGHWCGWLDPNEGLHTHCAILPPSVASSNSIIEVPIVDSEPSAPTLGMQATKVISKAGTTIVEQEFPLRTDKDGQAHTCVRPDPEDDFEVICLVYAQ